MRKLIVLLALPLVLAAAPQPTGTIALHGITDGYATFDVTVDLKAKPESYVFISLYCYDEAGLPSSSYYGATNDSFPVSGEECYAYLIYQETRPRLRNTVLAETELDVA